MFIYSLKASTLKFFGIVGVVADLDAFPDRFQSQLCRCDHGASSLSASCFISYVSIILLSLETEQGFSLLWN